MRPLIAPIMIVFMISFVPPSDSLEDGSDPFHSPIPYLDVGPSIFPGGSFSHFIDLGDSDGFIGVGRSTIIPGRSMYEVFSHDQYIPPLKVSFRGSNPVDPIGADATPATFNCYFGMEADGWMVGMNGYECLVYPDLYHCIDLQMKFIGPDLKTEFVVHPGGDPSDIDLIIDGTSVHANGNYLEYGNGLHEGPLVVKQGDALIGSSYLSSEGVVGYSIGPYDRSSDLVIDPLLTTSTFIGGNEWDMYPLMEKDGGGNLLVAGETESTNLPSTPGSAQTSHAGNIDLFVCSIDESLTDLNFLTYLGGSMNEVLNGISFNGSDRAYIGGASFSTDYPTTSGVVNQTFRGGTIDGILTAVSITNGAMLSSSYFGGSESDRVLAIDSDRIGRLVATGFTASVDFWTSPGAYRRTLSGDEDNFISTLSPDLKSTIGSTLIGGSYYADRPSAVKVDMNGSIVVCGQALSWDYPITPGVLRETYGSYIGYVTKMEPDLSSINASTYTGNGSWIESMEIMDDWIYLVGRVMSPTYPSTSDAFDKRFTGEEDGFITIVSRDLKTLHYSSFIGGNEDLGEDPHFDYEEAATSVAVSMGGSIFITGYTNSDSSEEVGGIDGFPITLDAYDNVNDELEPDSFLVVLRPGGTSIAYSTFLGGANEDRGWDIELNSSKGVTILGFSYSNSMSSNFPTTVGSYDRTFNGGYDLTLTSFKLDSDVPSKPLNPHIRPGDSWIELDWEPPLSDGNETLLGYYIYRDSSKTPIGPIVDGYYNDTNLMKGKNYLYRICAFNKVGKGLGVLLNGTPYSKPSAPSIIDKERGDRWMRIVWMRPIDMGGFPSVTYLVYVKTAEGTDIVPVDGTSHTFENLTNGLEYRFRVSAVNPKGEGPLSLPLNLTTYGVPSEPRNFRSRSGDRTLYLEWDVPLYDGGSYLTYTLVLYDRYMNPLVEVTSIQVLDHEFGSLRNGVLYNVSLQTIGLLGDSQVIWLFNLTPYGNVSTVFDLEVVQDNASIVLTWDPPLDLGGSRNIRYKVYSELNGSRVMIASGLEMTYHRVEPIEYGKEYTFRVSAENELFEGDLSEPVSIIPYGLPSAPRDPRVDVGDSFMNLTWRTPSDLGGDPSTSYRVFIGTDIANLYPDSMVTGVWYNFTNLIKGTTYFISVKAVNARGEGPSSQVLNGTPRSRPSPPTSLSYTQGDGFINVSWSPPKDDGGAPLLGYSVYLGTSRTDLSKKETQLEGRYLLIEGLINGRIYYVAAAVENSLGSSEMSDVLEAVPMTYPSAPVLVNHSAGDGWIEVSWEEPLDDGGSPIWLYHILLGTDGSDPVLYKIVSPTVRSYRIVGLENGRKYSVSLSCENSFGSSQPTVPIELIPQPEKEDTDVPILLFVAAGIAAVILLAAVLAIYLNIRSSRRERFLRMYRERKRREE